MSAATPGRRAVALRLAEKRRRLLRSGDYEKALVHFEKALAFDGISYQPYIYFYLARTLAGNPIAASLEGWQVCEEERRQILVDCRYNHY
jgi:hypothetical protein